MTGNAQEVMTKNYMQFCYTCDDAHLCTTEEACKACWAEKGLLNEEDQEAEGVTETRQLLMDYYA